MKFFWERKKQIARILEKKANRRKDLKKPKEVFALLQVHSSWGSYSTIISLLSLPLYAANTILRWHDYFEKSDFFKENLEDLSCAEIITLHDNDGDKRVKRSGGRPDIIIPHSGDNNKRSLSNTLFKHGRLLADFHTPDLFEITKSVGHDLSKKIEELSMNKHFRERIFREVKWCKDRNNSTNHLLEDMIKCAHKYQQKF